MEERKHRVTPLNILFVVSGCITLVLGTIGIFLPVLPTVPFYMLTAFLFAKGSKKFHDWFVSTGLYKKHVALFAKYHAMTLRGILTLMIFVSAMLMSAIYFADNQTMTVVIWVLIFCKYLYFILRINIVSKNKMKELQDEAFE